MPKGIQGYRHALEKAQLPYTPEQVIAQDLKESQWAGNCQLYSSNAAQARWSFYYRRSDGCRVHDRAATAGHTRFPHDIAVVGFNDER